MLKGTKQTGKGWEEQQHIPPPASCVPSVQEVSDTNDACPVILANGSYFYTFFKKTCFCLSWFGKNWTVLLYSSRQKSVRAGMVFFWHLSEVNPRATWGHSQEIVPTPVLSCLSVQEDFTCSNSKSTFAACEELPCVFWFPFVFDSCQRVQISIDC